MTERAETIAFLLRSTHLSGAERRFIAIAAALTARGQRAIVVLERSDLVALERTNGGPLANVVAFDMPGWTTLLTRGRKRFPRLHRMSGARWLYRFIRGIALERLQREQAIAVWHVALDTDLAHSVAAPALFEVTSPDWADRIASDAGALPEGMPMVAVSESVRERLRGQGAEGRLFLAPLLFANRDPAAAAPVDMAAKEKRIVFAHRLIPRKNGLLFAEVALRFLRANPDWTIAVHGVGPQHDAIASVLAEEMAGGRAELGHVSDLPAQLRRSRIFVSIIEPDNYPSQSVLEAMVCGNALLLSDTGRSREKFMQDNGAMTPIDAGAILVGLSGLVEDDAALDAMGAMSRLLAEARFSQDAYILHLGILYAQLGFSGLGDRLAAQDREVER